MYFISVFVHLTTYCCRFCLFFKLYLASGWTVIRFIVRLKSCKIRCPTVDFQFFKMLCQAFKGFVYSWPRKRIIIIYEKTFMYRLQLRFLSVHLVCFFFKNIPGQVSFRFSGPILRCSFVDSCSFFLEGAAFINLMRLK